MKLISYRATLCLLSFALVPGCSEQNSNSQLPAEKPESHMEKPMPANSVDQNSVVIKPPVAKKVDHEMEIHGHK
ncbi:MAG: hypothetical protein OQK04_09530, partial [Kangiellaceae bacterium]|nr:hypothetical protein [Kangiellaceae bacterium]